MLWDVPRYRIRAYVRKMQKTTTRRTSHRPKLHMQRTRAEVKVIDGFASPPQVVEARIILNDITPSGLYIFSSTPFYEGQQVSLNIQEPHIFYAKGRVVVCTKLEPSTRILTANPFPYRIYVKFEFQSLYEKNAVRMYCFEVLKKYLYGGHA